MKIVDYYRLQVILTATKWIKKWNIKLVINSYKSSKGQMKTQHCVTSMKVGMNVPAWIKVYECTWHHDLLFQYRQKRSYLLDLFRVKVIHGSNLKTDGIWLIWKVFSSTIGSCIKVICFPFTFCAYVWIMTRNNEWIITRKNESRAMLL